jgi:lysozyme
VATDVQLAAALCRRFEGFRGRPYLCPAGVPTIGYGSTTYEHGGPVRLTDATITPERANALLLHDILTRRKPAVIRLCPGADTPERRAALIDFAFNLGTGALASSTLRKRVNAGRWEDAKHELGRWVRGGGRVLPGLVKRRAAEALLLR